jgi:hypothetical protein
MTYRRRAMRRIQISLDGDMLERLRLVADARGTSVAGVIRDAVELAFPADPAARQGALRRLAADELLDDRRPATEATVVGGRPVAR